MSFLSKAKFTLASLILRQRVLNRWAHKYMPAKRLAACVLLFDDQDRLLILKTTYRREWLLPGGLVERNESPWVCAAREVKEEIGIEIRNLRFAAMDWRSADDEYDDSLHFIFLGGRLTSEQQAAVQPDGVEIAECRFVVAGDVEALVEPHLYRRVRPFLSPAPNSAETAHIPLVLNRGEPDDLAS